MCSTVFLSPHLRRGDCCASHFALLVTEAGRLSVSPVPGGDDDDMMMNDDDE